MDAQQAAAEKAEAAEMQREARLDKMCTVLVSAFREWEQKQAQQGAN